MTKDEFLKQKTEIKEKYKKLENELIAEKSKEENFLIKKYLKANKNSKYKVGDIIEGCGIIIKVEKIIYNYDYFCHDIQVNYQGVKLTKKLRKDKSGEIELILESNISKVIKEQK